MDTNREFLMELIVKKIALVFLLKIETQKILILLRDFLILKQEKI